MALMFDTAPPPCMHACLSASASSTPRIATTSQQELLVCSRLSCKFMSFLLNPTSVGALATCQVRHPRIIPLQFSTASAARASYRENVQSRGSVQQRALGSKAIHAYCHPCVLRLVIWRCFGFFSPSPSASASDKKQSNPERAPTYYHHRLLLHQPKLQNWPCQCPPSLECGRAAECSALLQASSSLAWCCLGYMRATRAITTLTLWARRSSVAGQSQGGQTVMRTH